MQSPEPGAQRPSSLPPKTQAVCSLRHGRAFRLHSNPRDLSPLLSFNQEAICPAPADDEIMRQWVFYYCSILQHPATPFWETRALPSVAFTGEGYIQQKRIVNLRSLRFTTAEPNPFQQAYINRLLILAEVTTYR